jgi:NAD(P)-dependent dehydrogenase (short-subunit alcohol dehydrogenase family)
MAPQASALITGSTSGIGRAAAEALARRGHRVLVSGRNQARGDAVVADIRNHGGTAEFIRAELSAAASARALAAAAGPIDILVNNAGSFPFAATLDTTEELFDDVVSLDLKVPFFLTAALVPAMIEKGRGAVVNVSTVAGSKGLTGATVYGASKAALEQLTRIWAAEFGPSGVRVNAVLSGSVETEGFEASGLDPTQFVAITPLARLARPAEIAEAIAYLASDDASYVNGALLAVDGGVLAS